MTQSIIALVGISGVGKSTLLCELSKDLSFQHLQASALIKSEREAATLFETSTDDLCNANIADNQALLTRLIHHCGGTRWRA
jgi:adenylate kinase